MFQHFTFENRCSGSTIVQLLSYQYMNTESHKIRQVIEEKRHQEQQKEKEERILKNVKKN